MPNDVTLQEGHPVDENLRPLKVGGKATALETAQQGNGARVNGDLEVTGSIPTVATNRIISETLDDGITMNSGKAITLDSNAGNFIAKKAGTEFSVANSAYAGMILGYRMIGESGGHATYTMTTDMTVVNSDMTVRFIAPPSGKVEVMVQIMSDGNANRVITFALSDNSTFNSLGDTYQQTTGQDDETDSQAHQHYWIITGLTAGDTYNYWFAASSNGGLLAWGGTGSGRYCDFIMKVTALPAATADFAVYG